MDKYIVEQPGQEIIKSTYSIKTKEQAAYEIIMGGPVEGKSLLFTLARKEKNTDNDTHKKMLAYIIRGWKNEYIWEMAFKFIDMIGYDNIPRYNAGAMSDEEIPEVKGLGYKEK